jgi:hypothetical protein
MLLDGKLAEKNKRLREERSRLFQHRGLTGYELQHQPGVFLNSTS